MGRIGVKWKPSTIVQRNQRQKGNESNWQYSRNTQGDINFSRFNFLNWGSAYFPLFPPDFFIQNPFSGITKGKFLKAFLVPSLLDFSKRSLGNYSFLSFKPFLNNRNMTSQNGHPPPHTMESFHMKWSCTLWWKFVNGDNINFHMFGVHIDKHQNRSINVVRQGSIRMCKDGDISSICVL